jgi:hypothetical protein
MYHIERALKKLRVMVDKKARVEGCTAKEFKVKEIAYFTTLQGFVRSMVYRMCDRLPKIHHYLYQ